MSETQEAAYLEPLRQEMASTEAEITTLEERLSELRAKRTGLGRALSQLDPRWAANHKPKKGGSKSKSGTFYGVSENRLVELSALIEERFADKVFTNTDLEGLTSIHGSTISKITNELHRRGVLRLDHKGGHRGVQHFYRLVSDGD